jgi:hypothetical protein
MAMNSTAAMSVALFFSLASVCWSAAFAWARWLARPQRETRGVDEHERRFVQIEQAIDAVAIEVERLGEGQRYLTRLLGKRLPEEVQPRDARSEYRRVDTPH